MMPRDHDLACKLWRIGCEFVHNDCETNLFWLNLQQQNVIIIIIIITDKCMY